MNYLTAEQFFSAQLPLESAFHALRHFPAPCPNFLEILRKEGISDSDIDREIRISGSKFQESFCKDPVALFELMKKIVLKDKLSYPWQDNIAEVHAEFEKNVYPSGIGFDGVVCLDELTESERRMATKRPRGDDNPYPVNFIRMDSMPPTWKANVIVKKRDAGGLEVLTMFPGTLTKPIPDSTFSPEQYSECDEFWRRHAFINGSR